MTKIVINATFGGFGLSPSAVVRYCELKGLPEKEFSDWDVERDDPVLLQVIEEMGDRADGKYSSLKIVEIPDDVQWQIEEYDGREHVAEAHRTWD